LIVGLPVELDRGRGYVPFSGNVGFAADENPAMESSREPVELVPLNAKGLLKASVDF